MRRRYFKIRLLLFTLVIICFLSACVAGDESQSDVPLNQSKNEDSDEHEGSNQEKITIGFSMDTLEEERWIKDRDLFKEAVESLGAEVEIMVANDDHTVQISQAETLISRGIDVLVIVPHNAEAAASIVNKAHSSGIKVLSYDRLVTNANIDMYISFDNEQVGEMQAEAIISLAPKGKYVYIGGAIKDNNAHLLKKGMLNVLQPMIDNGDIAIVFDQWTTDWTPTNALWNMQTALEVNINQIDAVIAANDATAGGAIQALEAQGLAGEIPVAGQDADLAAAQRIVEGTQTMTVYKPIKTLAEEAAKLAVMLATGEEVETERKINNGKIEVPSVLLAPIAVNKYNIEETIIADGFHSREDVFKNVEK